MSYKITCEPVKNMFGKKTGEHKANLGTFETYAKTKQDAIDELTKGLDWFFDDIDIFLTHVIQCKNCFFIIEKEFIGYKITQYYRHSQYSTCDSWLDRMPSYAADVEFDKYVDRYLECAPEDSRLFN